MGSGDKMSVVAEFRARAKAKGEGMRDLREFVPAASPEEDQFSPVKFYSIQSEVLAAVLRPDAADLSAATAAAAERGYKLRFEQGDATRLKFADASFDVVVCSLFLYLAIMHHNNTIRMSY